MNTTPRQANGTADLKNGLKKKSVRGYNLLNVIGTGGFGVVFRAFQPSIGRVVAIKVISPNYANRPEFIRRFEREARFLAHLEHLNIVPIHDYWRDKSGAYLVMRFLRGGNLGLSLDRDGAWEAPLAGQLIDQIASALAAAHQRGIVHQDIKPGNILLDEMYNGYLTDFGIAADLHDLVANEDQYGSPAYMSPEQAVHGPITPQSDIYSLGLLAYALLTGKSPYEGCDPKTVSDKVVNEPVPPLAVQRPDVPPEVDDVIQRATQKDPQERYGDVISFAAAFRSALCLPERPYFLPLPQDDILEAHVSPTVTVAPARDAATTF